MSERSLSSSARLRRALGALVAIVAVHAAVPVQAVAQVMPQRDVEAKVRSMMPGMNYLGSDLRDDGLLRMVFMRGGQRVWVDVDPATAKIVARGVAAPAKSEPAEQEPSAASPATIAGYEYCMATHRGTFYIGPVHGGAHGPELSEEALDRYNLGRAFRHDDESALAFEDSLRQRYSLSEDTNFTCDFYPSRELAERRRRGFIDSTLEANRDHDAGYKIVEVK